MAIIALPNNLPKFSLQVSLDGTTYTLYFAWNVRMQAWFMTLLDATDQFVIVADVRVVAQWFLSVYFTGIIPPAWAQQTYAADDRIVSVGNVYACVSAGPGPSTAPPTGTSNAPVISGASPPDGYTWQYISPLVNGRSPPGLLMAYDTSGEGIDPGLTDLGQRVQLIYYTVADVAALAAAP